MKIFFAFLIILAGCSNSEEPSATEVMKDRASRGKEECFKNGGVEFQFNSYYYSSTCVWVNPKYMKSIE